MDLNQVSVCGPQVVNDNNPALNRLGNSGEQIVQNLYGDYAELTRRGLVYTARSGAAAAIPINSTLTNSPTLWNPASSGKLVYLLQLLLSPGAIGTPVLTGLTLSWLKNTGDGVGTGAPIVTFTNIAPTGNLVGRGAATTRFANAVVTFTTQPAVLMDLGIMHWLEGTAATGAMLPVMYDFKGTVVLPPGTSVSVGAIAATSSTFWTSMVFAEVPLPPLWS